MIGIIRHWYWRLWIRLNVLGLQAKGLVTYHDGIVSLTDRGRQVYKELRIKETVKMK